MAEDAWQNLPNKVETRGGVAETVFEAGWPEVEEEWRTFSEEDSAFWAKLLLVRFFLGRIFACRRLKDKPKRIGEVRKSA